MLIVPVGDKEARRTTPWICILLILINIAVYAWTTHQDLQRDGPLTAEQANLLADYEVDLLLQWLSQQDSRTYADAVAMNDKGADFMMAYGWYDQAFALHVHQYWQQHPPANQWRQLRNDLEAWLHQQSTIRWGLIPNDPGLATLLSSQFMHGDWFHLLGNMLFLIMFGIAMERHWGARRFLTAYLLCGIGAGLLFIASAPDSGIPLVGASGAISGLMGLFAGTFRLRKLEFFYTLGFFFGSFRAPALVLFPVWLGWELIQAATMNSNVAYMAHAGGLLTGLALAFLLPFTGQPNRLKDTQPDTGGDDTQVPAICQQLAEQLRFDDAQSRCRQWLANHPKSRPLWFFFLQIGLRRKQLDAAMKEALKTLSQRQDSDALLGLLWQEYERLGGDIRTLPPAHQLLLGELAWRQQRRKRVREIVQDLEKKQWQHPRLERLSQRL